MIAVADLAERVGGDIRVTRLQNFVVANVPEAEVDDVVAGAGGDRLPARRQPRARTLDRVHGRAALQLLGDGDEDAARPADRAPRGALRRPDRRAPPPPRRLPARVRAALGRRPRLPGHDRPRRGGRAPAGVRHLRPRRPRARRGDRAAALPARPDRGARRGGRGARRTAGSRAAAPAESFAAFATRLSRRRARRRWPGSSRRKASASAERRRKRRDGDRADRRAGGRRALRRVRGRGARRRARVGARALLAADRDLDGVPDRRRRAPRHGVRDRSRRSASSASTPAGCRRRRST